jgi:DNA repair exonuclease SbcCD ATPase subunit
MEVKFFQLLNSYGVESNQTTKKINDMVAEFDEGWEEYQNALSDLESANDEDRQAMESDIKEYEEALQEQDELIVDKLKEWYKKKDIWAENAKKLAEGRENKKNLKNNANNEIPLVQSENNQPQLVAASNNALPNSLGVEPTVAEKKNGEGWFIFGAIALVITLGAVNMFKNK